MDLVYTINNEADFNLLLTLHPSACLGDASLTTFSYLAEQVQESEHLFSITVYYSINGDYLWWSTIQLGKHNVAMLPHGYQAATLPHAYLNVVNIFRIFLKYHNAYNNY